MPRVAATAALSSFILLLISIALMASQIFVQLNQRPKVENHELFAIISSGINPTLATATGIVLVVFVTSCCSLVITLLVATLVLLKESSGKLAERARRDLRKLERHQRKQPSGKESEGFRQTIRSLKYIQAIYPYFLILFDVLFYVCVAAIAITVVIAIGSAILGNLPNRF